MFDFAALPPEINSGRIYTGPGSGPLLAAASAWDSLAVELSLTATGYTSVVAELTTSLWIGPAAESMVAAVGPYVSWLSASAVRAEEAANHARAAAAAYETAFSMTVPPPVIAANRVLLMTLVATNVFGQNFPAIAAAEADYLEMWAQDATAMYGYAASAALATELSRFAAPPHTTDAHDGDTAPEAAHTIPQLLSRAAVRDLAVAPAGASPSDIVHIVDTPIGWAPMLGWLPTPDNNWAGLYPGMYNVLRQTLQAYFGVGLGNFGWSIGQQLFPGLGTTAGAGGAWYPTPQFAALGAGGWHFHSGIGVTAGTASAAHVGGLSVPASWGAATGSAQQTVPKLTSAHFATPAAQVSPDNVMNAALRGVPPGARNGERAGHLGVRYGLRHTVLTRPPSAG